MSSIQPFHWLFVVVLLLCTPYCLQAHRDSSLLTGQSRFISDLQGRSDYVTKPISSNQIGNRLRFSGIAKTHVTPYITAIRNAKSLPKPVDVSTTSRSIRWYHSIFPIHDHELPKFLSLSFMMFWIVYIFTMTRDTKDALIVTNCGAEAITFLKVYGVIPGATLFMLLYTYLSNHYQPQALFYITLLPFIVFYASFGFVLYPFRQYLHSMTLPVSDTGLGFAMSLIKYWSFSLYYIVSELWGSAGIPLLFWTCANDVIRVDQVRLYAIPYFAHIILMISI